MQALRILLIVGGAIVARWLFTRSSSVSGGGQVPFRPDCSDEDIAAGRCIDGGTTEPPLDGEAEEADADGSGRVSWDEWPYATTELGTPTDTPIPGFWYRVKSGDSLEGIARAAIRRGGTRTSSTITEARRLVAANPTKRAAPSSEYSRRVYPAGVLALFARYKRDPATVKETDATGGSFPLVFIPDSELDVPGGA